jgi:hypothetical protein
MHALLDELVLGIEIQGGPEFFRRLCLPTVEQVGSSEFYMHGS